MFYTSNAKDGLTSQISYKLNIHPTIRFKDISIANLSYDREFLAYIISNREVQIINVRNGEMITTRTCRGGDMWMLDIYWLSSNNHNIIKKMI